MPETVFLEGPHGEIEAQRLRNPKRQIDTWAFDCPACRTWGNLIAYDWYLDEDGRLNVDGVITCREFRCDASFRIEAGRIELI